MQPRESRVAGWVAGEQHKVIARGGAGVELPGPAAAGLGAADGVIELAAAASRAQLAIVAGNRQLHADDRADRDQARLASCGGCRLLRSLPEADRGVHAGVVGDRQGRHLQQGSTGDEILGVARAVEEAEVAVGVELAVGVRRRPSDRP